MSTRRSAPGRAASLAATAVETDPGRARRPATRGPAMPGAATPGPTIPGAVLGATPGESPGHAGPGGTPAACRTPAPARAGRWSRGRAAARSHGGSPRRCLSGEPHRRTPVRRPGDGRPPRAPPGRNRPLPLPRPARRRPVRQGPARRRSAALPCPDRSCAGRGGRPRASRRPVKGTRLRAPHRNEAGQPPMRQPRECLSSGRRL